MSGARSASWSRTLAALLMRSAAGKAVAWGTLAVTLAASIAFGVAFLFTMSPQQEAASVLGGSDAVISDPLDVGVPPGQTPAPEAWVDLLAGHDVETDVVLGAEIPLPTVTGGFERAIYVEGDASSPALQQRFDIAPDALPHTPGQCAISPSVAEDPQLPLALTATITGRVYPVYGQDAAILLCAPGTWEGWHLPEDVLPLASMRALAMVHLTGEEATSLADDIRSRQPDLDVMTRSEIVEWAAKTSPQTFMTSWLPLAMVPFIATFILSAAFGVWGGRTATTLHSVGLPRARLVRGVIVSAAALVSVGAAVGLLAGLLLMPGVRAALLSTSPGLVLNDDQMPLLIHGLVLASALVGSVSGVLLGLAGGLRSRSVSERLTTELQPHTRRKLLVASILALGAAALVVRLSDARTAYMVGGAVLGAVGSALLSAVALWWLARAMSARTDFTSRVAGRILRDDSRRWGMMALGLTAVSGLVATTFVYVTSSAAALLPLLASPVPTGVVALETLNPEGTQIPDYLIQQFETDLALTDPMRVTQRWYTEGPVWTFDSIADLERVTGPLTPRQQEGVLSGDLLSAGVFTEQSVHLTTMDQTPGPSVTLIPVRTGLTERLTYPRGLGLDATLPDSPVANTWLLYLNTPAGSDEAARAWPLAHGVSNIQVLSYTGEAEVSWSLWSSVSMVGFAAVILTVVGAAMRREAHTLQPLMGAFVAQGLSGRWARRVMALVAATLGLVCAIFALAGALYALALLMVNLSSDVFSPTGVPWWILVLFISLLPLASVSTALWATRGRVAPTLSQVQ